MFVRALLLSLVLASSGCCLVPGSDQTPAPAITAVNSPRPPASQTLQEPAASPTLAQTGAAPYLATPVSQEPAAGICGQFEGEWVTISITADIPDPRCARIAAGQKLRILNLSADTLQVRLGNFEATIAPGQEHLFDAPFGTYLAPGVHRIEVQPCCGAELWLGT